ncbi:MAG: hypothetical protein HQL72_15705 [Magnetococcales bacterium]|nr:hypothetical protein [Magnetococcales bacterium]
MKPALNKVLEAIDGLPTLDALKTLNNAMARLLDKDGSDNKKELVFDGADNHTSQLLYYSSVGRSKIRKDPELQDYIHDIARHMMLDEIRQACVERFGEERTPSRSSISRYLQKIRRELRKGEGL